MECATGGYSAAPPAPTRGPALLIVLPGPAYSPLALPPKRPRLRAVSLGPSAPREHLCAGSASCPVLTGNLRGCQDGHLWGLNGYLGQPDPY